MEEKVIKFCRAPSGLWIGWIVKDNAHYWGSGRTMDLMATHVKNTLYSAKKCSTAGYVIASRPSTWDEVPSTLMDKKFKTRAWWGGKGKEQQKVVVVKTKTVTKPARKAQPQEQYDYYETKMEGGDLVVFGIIKRQVARYNTLPDGVEPTVTPTDVKVAPLADSTVAEPQPVFDAKTDGAVILNQILG